jgi:hypothetical protein
MPWKPCDGRASNRSTITLSPNSRATTFCPLPPSQAQSH